MLQSGVTSDTDGYRRYPRPPGAGSAGSAGGAGRQCRLLQGVPPVAGEDGVKG